MRDNPTQIDTMRARAGPKSDGTHDITHFNRSKDSADFHSNGSPMSTAARSYGWRIQMSTAVRRWPKPLAYTTRTRSLK